MARYFADCAKIEASAWPYKFFKPVEFASRGDGSLLIVDEAVEILEKVRAAVGKPLIINSAYRDPIHNARVGGAPLSRHKFGDAFDISLSNQTRLQLIAICKNYGFRGLGVNYKSFVHVDLGNKRTW